MEKLKLLLHQVLLECGARYGVSTDLDWKTIEKRIDNEGLSFLTISLPEFANTFEKALAAKHTVPSDWPGWRISGSTPVFLKSFLDLVFDRESGCLLPDLFAKQRMEDKRAPFTDALNSEGRHVLSSSIHFDSETDIYDSFIQEWMDENRNVFLFSIASIRQVTRMFSKLEIEASKERIDAAYEQFKQVEEELADYDQKDWDHYVSDDIMSYLQSPFYTNGTDSKLHALDRIGNLLYGEVYTDMCTALMEGYPIPKHGPGSTADKLIGNKKFEQSEWPARLERTFPAGEYLLPSWRYK